MKLIGKSAALPLAFSVSTLLFALNIIAQPVNDQFADRVVISEIDHAIASGSLSNATFEPGEPMIAGVSSGQTAWWTWTAPANGIVSLNTVQAVPPGSTALATLAAVYLGNELTNLWLVASNNYVACYTSTNCGCHWRVRTNLQFHVQAGMSYQIAVDAPTVTDTAWVAQPPPESGPLIPWTTWISTQITNVPPVGAVQLTLDFTAAPANDDLSGALPLGGARAHLLASNAGATAEPGEPAHVGNSGGSSIWYSWTATASGRVTLSTSEIAPYEPPAWSGWYGSVDSILLRGFTVIGEKPDCGQEIDVNPPPTFFPLFAAYLGNSIDTLVSANCLPMNLTDFPYAVEFDVTKGQTYRIAFDGNKGSTGTAPLYLALTRPAVNDTFTKRIRIRGIYVAASGYNAGATIDPGQPSVPGSSGKTVWWSWVAPVSGPVTIGLNGSDHDFPIGIFSGATVSALDPVANGVGQVTFNAVRGVEYQIAVADAAGLTGAIRLTLQAPMVELPLLGNARGTASIGVLSYAASSGDVVWLQRSDDGANWINVTKAVAHRQSVSFHVRSAARSGGPYYRAILFDRAL